jgi:hypothetical protein
LFWRNEVDRLGDFEQVQFVLGECGSYMSASEVHGLATGMLCINHEADSNGWLKTILDADRLIREPSIEEQQELVTVFLGTGELLKNEDFIFDLFLPDDGESVAVRAAALSEWCQGFLYGMAFGGLSDNVEWGEDGEGVLKDLMEISRLDPGSSEEPDEQSFLELHEYVRVAVQILMAELQPDSDAAEPAAPTVH